MLLHAGTPTSGVAGHGMNADRVVAWYEPSLQQGTQQANCTGRIATGIGDTTCARNPLSLSQRHFRKAVCPVRPCAVGGTCVDYSEGRINNGLHCLARGGIRQTENGDVAGVNGFCATRWIFALPSAKREQSKVGPVAQPFVDLQPGGALVAVDENNGRAHTWNTPVTVARNK